MTEEQWWERSGGESADDRATVYREHFMPPAPPSPPYVAQPPGLEGVHGHDPRVAPTSKQRKQLPWRRILSVTAVAVALIAGGTVLIRYLTRGGASSPEEAVTSLLEGVTKQDPILAASMINPKEVPLLTDFMAEVGEAKERITQSDAKPVAGTQITLRGLRMRSKELSPRVSRVTIRSGRLSASVKRGSQLPEVAQSAFRTSKDKGATWNVDVNDLERDLANGVSAIVVKENGGWYVSPALTAADLYVSYSGNDLPEGDFDAYGEVNDFDKGAETPEDAIDQLADAISGGDPQELVGALPSDQAQFAVVFGDALEEVLARELDDSDAGPGKLPNGWAKLKSFDVRQEDGPGGTVRLLVDSATVSATGDDPMREGAYHHDWRLSGLDLCEKGERCSVRLTKDKSPLAKRINKVLDGSISLIAREIDGGWKIDPIASLLDMSSRLLRGLDKRFADAAVLSLDGKGIPLALGQKTKLSFDDNGYALLAVDTKPGSNYVVMVEAKNLDDADFAFGTERGAQRGRLDYGLDGGDGFAFTADLEQTPIALGGVLNEARTAMVTAYEIPVQNAAFDTQVQGMLTSPIAFYRVPLSGAPMYESGERSYLLTAAAGNGDVALSVESISGSGDTVGDRGEKLWLSASLYLDQGEDDSSEGTIADGDTGLVAVTGDVGTTFAFKLAAPTRGFDGGKRSGTVSVGPRGTTQVAFDLGGSVTFYTIGVSWDEPVDIDGQILVGGLSRDSDTDSTYDDFELSDRGSGAGVLRLRNYGDQSANVMLTIEFDD